MKLKEIPQNTVVHTPTEAEAKELLAILHENGYEWMSGHNLLEQTNWNIFEQNTCCQIQPSKRLLFCGLNFAHQINSVILTLADFKRKYCEEEKPQPKFKVGDIMRVTDAEHPLYNKQVKLDTWIDGGNYWLTINKSCGLNEFRESDLEPYTEPETKEEIMEAKELNLVELLRGHEGETFYSPIVGVCTLIAITDYIYVAVNDHPSYCFFLDGRREKSGAVVFFPSRALYEQYPLDPYTAWMKWQEEQKCHIEVIINNHNNDGDLTGCAYVSGDIAFRTPADRDKCIEEIKAIIKKYQK